MRRIIPIIALLVFISTASYSQVFKIDFNQPDPLSIASGNDTTICPGHTVILGANTVAWGGSEDYLYSWLPIDGLDDPRSPNPIASPEESTIYILTVVDASGCQMTDSININIDLCLGIENQSLSEQLVIYPNPSSGSINLSGLAAITGELKVSMINSRGVEVLYSVFQTGYGSIDLDLENMDLPRGIYFIRILTENEVLVRKIQLI